ncbi:Clotting factor B [Nymphon striatum]|nr:Clotting factor B [Nymphon striatum]
MSINPVLVFTYCPESDEYRCVETGPGHVKEVQQIGARRSNVAFPPSDALPPSRSRGTESCTTNEGLPGTCVLQYECPAKRTSNRGRTVAPTICKNHVFLVVICCPSDDLPPRSSNPLDKLKVPKCGSNTVTPHENRIIMNLPLGTHGLVGGEISGRFGWPWMAAIFIKRRGQQTYLCGGTVINDWYIVSAAHCFKKSASSRIVPERYMIRLAEHDITDNDNGQEHDVEKIIVHSEYKPPVAYNDIALLKVKRKFTANFKIQPICLPIGPEKYQNFTEEYGAVIGWGSTAYGESTSFPSSQKSFQVFYHHHHPQPILAHC